MLAFKQTPTPTRACRSMPQSEMPRAFHCSAQLPLYACGSPRFCRGKGSDIGMVSQRGTAPGAWQLGPPGHGSSRMQPNSMAEAAAAAAPKAV